MIGVNALLAEQKKTLRLFIAIALPEEIKSQLAVMQQQIIQNYGNTIKTIPKDNLHITMSFLGSRSGNDLDDIIARLAHIVIKPFLLLFHAIEYLDRGRNLGSLIWMKGVRSDSLTELKRSIDLALNVFEGHPDFVAHITLFRLKHEGKAALRKAVNDFRCVPFNVPVKSMSLMQSITTPFGPHYVELKRFWAIT